MSAFGPTSLSDHCSGAMNAGVPRMPLLWDSKGCCAAGSPRMEVKGLGAVVGVGFPGPGRATGTVASVSADASGSGPGAGLGIDSGSVSGSGSGLGTGSGSASVSGLGTIVASSEANGAGRPCAFFSAPTIGWPAAPPWTSLASPKSTTRSRPSRGNSTLLGFKSRCSTLCAWASLRASAMASPMRRDSFTPGRSSATRSRRVCPGRYSRAR